ncbi:MAG: Gfo/Idh/MocA family protein [Gemmataceae bacterium]
MRFVNRREFLKDSAAVAAALAGAHALTADLRASEKAAKAEKSNELSDPLRVAVIGVHGRGMSHVEALNNHNSCVITTICDTDSAVVGPAIKAVEKARGEAPKFEQDIRKVLDDKNIDIITIATPNHWHSLAAIWALQADKHVYVEKPVSHNVSEGRRVVETARKYNKICQTGTQCRSMPGTRQAMAFLHDGKLGKISVARGLCYKLRGSIGKVKGPQAVPSTVNYDLWCGPAPNKPLMRQHLHYDWHWTWDYGNGDLGNQGIHQMDVARWGLNKNELAKSVQSLGGRFGYVDDGETANTQICVFDYGDCELIFEVRGLPTKKLLNTGVGNIFYGSEGYMVCPGYDSAVAYTPKGEVIQKFGGGADHFANFIKAVRSGKKDDLNADILEGHLSSALCHLGNISYRLGTEVPFNKKTHAFGDDKDAGDSLARMEEHLKDNAIALDEAKYRLGPKLAINPKSESFVGNKAADAMLTREYRKGFEVPEKL